MLHKFLCDYRCNLYEGSVNGEKSEEMVHFHNEYIVPYTLPVYLSDIHCFGLLEHPDIAAYIMHSGLRCYMCVYKANHSRGVYYYFMYHLRSDVPVYSVFTPHSVIVDL